MDSIDNTDGELTDEDEGNQSDPGVGGQAPASARTLRRRAEELAHAADEKQRRRRLVERSERETRMVYPCGWNAVVHMLEVQRELDEMRNDVAGSRRTLDEALGGETSLEALVSLGLRSISYGLQLTQSIDG